ncbi:MAG: IS1 family transposase [Cytophagaceae bacterium]|nr:MAG: IS1 family transposase [Cytophagaceae bacterium]
MLSCPLCHAITGQTRSGRNSQGNQRYFCTACSRRYVEQDARSHTDGIREQVLRALQNGSTVRDTAAMFEVGVATVMRWKSAQKPSEPIEVVTRPVPSRAPEAEMLSAAEWMEAD